MNKSFILAVVLLGLVSANLLEISKEFRNDQFQLNNDNGWKFIGFQSVRTSTCAGQTLVGGPGVVATGSMSKEFTSDIDLNVVYIQFDLYLIDQWLSGWEGGRDQNTLFRVFVNDKQVHQLGSDYTRQLHASSANLCGQTNPDRKTHVNLTVPVTGKKFTIRIQANIASNNPNVASWGIRELYVMTDFGPNNTTQVVKELFDDSNFDVSKWTSNFGQGVSTCPNKLLGGYGVAGPGAQMTRKLTALPPHSFLVVSFNAFFVDSADANDSVVFYVDGKIVHEHNRFYIANTANVCGAGWNDGNEKLSFLIPHFDETAEIKMYVNYDQGAGDESFGIREFQVSASAPCPMIYSENNQKGKVFSFCGSIPDLREVGWTFPIKGIYIPKGLQLTVYEDSKYFGKNYSLTKSNFNLQGNEYVLVNKAFHIDVNEKKLKRNH